MHAISEIQPIKLKGNEPIINIFFPCNICFYSLRPVEIRAAMINETCQQQRFNWSPDDWWKSTRHLSFIPTEKSSWWKFQNQHVLRCNLAFKHKLELLNRWFYTILHLPHNSKRNWKTHIETQTADRKFDKKCYFRTALFHRCFWAHSLKGFWIKISGERRKWTFGLNKIGVGCQCHTQKNPSQAWARPI